MKCECCGTELPDNAAYCPECGFVIPKPEQSEPVPQPAEEVESPASSFAPERNDARSDSYNDADKMRSELHSEKAHNEIRSESTGKKVVYCSNCGKPLDSPDSEFCRSCGAKVGDSANDVVPKVGFVQAYRDYWKGYARLSGTTTRAGYWYVVLWNIILGFALGILSVILIAALGTGSAAAGAADEGVGAAVLGAGIIAYILIGLWGLVNILPGICIVVRRLHDSGRSGGWIFIALVPWIGELILLVFMLQPHSPNAKKYAK